MSATIHTLTHNPVMISIHQLPSSLYYKMHFSRQSNYWSLRCIWSIACRRCSNNIFILHLTLGFNIDNCKLRRETVKFWDLVHLLLEILWYISHSTLHWPLYCWIYFKQYKITFLHFLLFLDAEMLLKSFLTDSIICVRIKWLHHLISTTKYTKVGGLVISNHNNKYIQMLLWNSLEELTYCDEASHPTGSLLSHPQTMASRR